MVNVIFTIGPAGCGKSTWANKQKDYIVFDPDEYRKYIWGDSQNQNNPALVWSILMQDAIREIIRNKNVIICGTNVKIKDCQKMLLTLKQQVKTPYYTTAAFFEVSPEQCIENDKKRDRHVPSSVIYRQYAAMQNNFSQLKEIFDKNIYLTWDANSGTIKEKREKEE